MGHGQRGEAFMLPAWTNFRLNTKAFPHLNRHDRHASNRSAGHAEWNLHHFGVEILRSDVETCSSMKVRRSYHLKVCEHFKVLTCFNTHMSTYGHGTQNVLDHPAVIRTSGTRGLREEA